MCFRVTSPDVFKLLEGSSDMRNLFIFIQHQEKGLGPERHFFLISSFLLQNFFVFCIIPHKSYLCERVLNSVVNHVPHTPLSSQQSRQENGLSLGKIRKEYWQNGRVNCFFFVSRASSLPSKPMSLILVIQPCYRNSSIPCFH